MKAVITVTGKDSVGIIAKVATICSEYNANIVDVTQSILDEYFAMIMLVDMSEATEELSVIAQACTELGKQIGMSIYLQHEDIFNAMHTI